SDCCRQSNGGTYAMCLMYDVDCHVLDEEQSDAWKDGVFKYIRHMACKVALQRMYHCRWSRVGRLASQHAVVLITGVNDMNVGIRNSRKIVYEAHGQRVVFKFVV
ncbi:9754_t:CDS:2, partial [Paraglomus brasilianum]